MECTACLLQPHCSLQPHRRYKDPSAYRAQQASLLLLLPTIHSRAPGSLATSCYAQIGISHCGWLPDPSPTPWGTHTALLPRSRCCREGEMMRKRAAQSLASPHFPQTHNTAVPLPWCPPTPHAPYLGRWPCCCRCASPAATHCTASHMERRHRSASAPGSPAHMSASRHSTATTPLLRGPLGGDGV